MSVSREVYEERKKNGLCTKCGKLAEQNKTLCPAHLQIANKNQKAVYARRQNSRLCFKCGSKLTNNRKTCNDCLNKNVEMDRAEVYIPVKKRRSLGLCYLCGKPSHKYNCNECEEKYGIITPQKRKELALLGLCGQCGKRPFYKNQKTCEKCLKRQKSYYYTSGQREKMIVQTRELRIRVVNHYGGRCVCCGETEYTFLAIDHINGGGNEHRRKIKKNGSNILKWLIKQDFPPEFQILCHNCNMSKYLNGGVCAHKRVAIGYDIEHMMHSSDCIFTVYPDNPAIPCSCGLQDALDEQNEPKLFY